MKETKTGGLIDRKKERKKERMEGKRNGSKDLET